MSLLARDISLAYRERHRGSVRLDGLGFSYGFSLFPEGSGNHGSRSSGSMIPEKTGFRRVLARGAQLVGKEREWGCNRLASRKVENCYIYAHIS